MKPKGFPNYIKETNKKDPKFKVGNHVRISKYKNIFAKGYTRNWSEEVFVINTAPCAKHCSLDLFN